MASRRSYHAFIRAARKDGGLSLPAARRVYRKVSERLGEPAKAVDLKRHPRIFRDALLKRDREKLKQREKEKHEKKKEKERRSRVIETFEEFEGSEDLFLEDEIEYASTAEY